MILLVELALKFFGLQAVGYEVIGSDINANMLRIARNKAKKANLSIKFIKGDMRTLHVGMFDAVLTIFNAIGHLTKSDFEKSVQNIADNLKKGGLYIFDIFNLNYLLKDNHITDLTIDWQKFSHGITTRKIQYSTIDRDGILASYTIRYEQKDAHKPKMVRGAQTLQIYTAQELREMLERNGFRVLKQCAIDGSKFFEDTSDCILTMMLINFLLFFTCLMLQLQSFFNKQIFICC